MLHDRESPTTRSSKMQSVISSILYNGFTVFNTDCGIQVEIIVMLCVRLAVQERNFYFCLYHPLNLLCLISGDKNAEVECKLQHRVDM
jgi:hypothetical protein